MKKKLLVLILTLFTAVNANAFELKNPLNDVNNDVGSNGGIFLVNDSKYTEKGTWEDYRYTGYDNSPIRIAKGSGDFAQWTNNPSVGFKYDVYIWKSVIENGDKNAKAVITTNTEAIEKTIDFSQGYTGWIRVGVVQFADSFGNVRLVAGDGNMPVSACKYVMSSEEDYNADRIFDKNADLMILKRDSVKVLHNHEYKNMEDAAPTVINNTMMIPLRFVSENMGYECEWNEQDRSVTVVKNGMSVVFKIDSAAFSVNGEVKKLEQAPVIMNSRTMLPIRALSESFGNDVIWNDSGVVLIGKDIVIDENISEKFYEAVNSVL